MASMVISIACGDAKGSNKGYARHYAAKEKPCEECRQAQNVLVGLYNTARYRARRRLLLAHPIDAVRLREKLSTEGLRARKLAYALDRAMEGLHTVEYYELLDEEYRKAGLR